MKKIITSVSNDVVTDQRLHRIATTLSDYFDVTVAGRKLPASLPLEKQNYNVKRFRLLFNKGPLFYMNLNIRLFFYLLWNKADALLANDLDTLLPNFLVSKIKRIPLYYDSHEYFTGVPELQNRKFVKSVWKWIEKSIVPQLNNAYTVNDSIAKLYNREYNIAFDVVRNIPMNIDIEKSSREELNLPADRIIIIFQGAGINIDRGAEEALMAMKYLPEKYLLLFIGGGDVFSTLQSLANKELLSNKVMFLPKQPYKILRQYTMHASIGLTIDKDTNLNYRYSLPNKLFDYIHSGVPVLASNLVEVERIIKKYNVGRLVNNHQPELIAKAIDDMVNSPEYHVWKNNTIIAAAELNWEKEKQKLLRIFNI